MPATVGCGAVLRGLRLVIGASEGWGGGVARNMSSFSVYVPVDRIVIFQRRYRSLRVQSLISLL